jgi:hypothetical protein
MILDITILIALIVGLTQVFKKAGFPERFIPVVALILGVSINTFVKFIGAELGEVIIVGLIAGLTSMGLYDTAKITILGK